MEETHHIPNIQLDMARLPRHIAIIMDGNGRWAQARGLERAAGHVEGVATVRRITEEASRLGIGYLTLYAFSTENWNRPQAEVDALMHLIATAIERETPDLIKNNVSLRVIGDASNVFVEEGASLECCVLNTTTGPIYIGRDATVMEGSLIRGPFALCEHATINMGTKVYPDTTVGPWCKAGGELNNAVMHSYSNKAHDGFLGNAVVGSWCNLGAGCVASNLKNTYDLIRLWNYPLRRFERTKLQFCGLIMGDHSKAGINTMFNTATVIGVGCNIFGPGLPRTFIPSFTTGNASGFTDVPMEQFFDTAIRMMGRRHVELTRRMYLAVRDAADGL